MATPKLSWLSLSLGFLVLCHGSLAFQGQEPRRRFHDQSECRLEKLNAQEPTRRFTAEAGVTEYWDANNDQFKCAGVAAIRFIIEPKGLLLPEFSNAPRLVYIVQGRGITGALIPGCPESYQSFQQSQQSEEERGQSQRYRDQHQKIRHFRQGDIIALPEGVAHWCYNDGEQQVVAVSVLDTSSSTNQLDQNLRKFHLAGSQPEERSQQYPRVPHPERSSGNIFRGFDVQMLAESFGVSKETARKLQNPDDQRGNIILVKDGLRVVRPPRREEDEEQKQQVRKDYNGLEETLCNLRLTENVADPTRADVYSPQGGRITTLNSQKLPILSYLRLNAERGVLYRNALLAPHWNLNANSVVYITRGRGRVQIVGNKGNTVHDSELREGQILIVPQAFAAVAQAGNEGIEWIAFMTNDNAMSSPLAGKTSAIRGMPDEVIMNSYRISREDARKLKYNRGEEMIVLAPRVRSQGRASA